MGTASVTKFLRNVLGTLTEKAALTTSVGAADADNIPALNASGILDDSIINASATSSANKVVKMNGTGVIDDAILNASAASGANKVVKMTAAGVIAPAVLNATASSAGAADANKIAQLDASGRLDPTVLPVGIGADTGLITTSEALVAVHMYLSGMPGRATHGGQL